MTFTRCMAIMVLLITFAYLFGVTFIPIPESGIEHSKTIEGFLLGSAVGTIITYYWGASKRKDPKETDK